MNRIVLSDRRVLQFYPSSASLEWLETNGTGAFAMGTVAGANTRRHHGHLIAPDGSILLSKFDEELVRSGQRTGLSVNQYPGQLHPRGHEYLQQFRLDPYPIWRYCLDETILERSLFLVPGRTLAIVEWRLLAGPKCWLEVRPFFSQRGMPDALQRSLPLPPAWPALQHSTARVFPDGYWYFNFEYDTGHEDLHSPALYQFRLEAGQTAWMAIGAGNTPLTTSAIETARQQRLARGACRAEDFLIAGDHLRSAYPHPGSTLEHELIALPGLLLTHEHDAAARRILARAVDQPKPSLWLFPALMAYQRKHGQDAFLAGLALTQALDAWLPDCDAATGLLPAPAGTNALWLNALLSHKMLSALFDTGLAERRRYEPLRRLALAHYQARFWPSGQVRELDPQQLLAVSLPFLCVTEDLAAAIVDALSLTPVGGTWMLAHYLSAYFRVHGRTPEALKLAQREVSRAEAELARHCLGHLPQDGASASAIRLAELCRAQQLLSTALDW